MELFSLSRHLSEDLKLYKSPWDYGTAHYVLYLLMQILYLLSNVSAVSKAKSLTFLLGLSVYNLQTTWDPACLKLCWRFCIEAKENITFSDFKLHWFLDRQNLFTFVSIYWLRKVTIWQTYCTRHFIVRCKSICKVYTFLVPANAYSSGKKRSTMFFTGQIQPYDSWILK